MKWEVMAGREPKPLKGQPGMYAPIYEALALSDEGQWLSVWAEDDRAEIVRAAISSTSNNAGRDAIRDKGFVLRTAVRRHKHEPEYIPEGRALVFFRKVRNGKT